MITPVNKRWRVCTRGSVEVRDNIIVVSTNRRVQYMVRRIEYRGRAYEGVVDRVEDLRASGVRHQRHGLAYQRRGADLYTETRDLSLGLVNSGLPWETSDDWA